MSTYFFVRSYNNDFCAEFGPYVEFKEAAGILVDHLPLLLSVLGINDYRAQIVERAIIDNRWQDICVKVDQQ